MSKVKTLWDVLGGMTGYHGTPHLFDKFQLSKIGTGEGAQAYGHGLYFAEDPSVARYYRDNLSDAKTYYGDGEIDTSWTQAYADPEDYVLREFSNYKKDPLLMDGLNDDPNLLGHVFEQTVGYDIKDGNLTQDQFDPIMRAFNSLDFDDVSVKSTGKLYQADLPSKQALLDWDSPMGSQSSYVQGALKPANPDMPGRVYYDDLISRGANELYTRNGPIWDTIANDPQRLNYHPAELPAAYLRSKGVPGHTYFDGSSRRNGAGNKNIVMNDESGINIRAIDDHPLEWYKNKGLLSAGGLGMLGMAGASDEAEAGAASSVAKQTRFLFDNAFDPRYSGSVPGGDPRVGVQDRIRQMTYEREPMAGGLPEANKLSIFDLEGKPFITSMSDQTAGGEYLNAVNGVEFDNPVPLLGGQDYMLMNKNQGKLWASAQTPSNDIYELSAALKKQTGESPLFMPWRMAPTGSDFANMNADTMVQYIKSDGNRDLMKHLDNLIKTKDTKVMKDGKKTKVVPVGIPDWPGFNSRGLMDYMHDLSGDQRKLLADILDKQATRNKDILSVGEARIATADTKQLDAPQGGLMNVGEIDFNRSVYADASHPAYPYVVPGSMKGRLKEDVPVYSLLGADNIWKKTKEDGLHTYSRPEVVGNEMSPTNDDLRALQMGARGGIITEDRLRALENAGYLDQRGSVTIPMLAATGAAGGGVLAAIDQGLGSVAEGAMNLMDMPLRGILGLTAMPSTLASGGSWAQALDEGAKQAAQDSDKTLFGIGDDVARRTGSPLLGTAAYTMPMIMSPF